MKLLYDLFGQLNDARAF